MLINAGKVVYSQKQYDYKSKGEMQIAMLLDNHRIRYQYEYPLAVKERGKVRIWYPDFHLPEYGLFLEYAGMKNESYKKMLQYKKQVYKNAGIEVLFVEPGEFSRDGDGRILGGIEEILLKRRDKFYRRKELA